MPAIGEHTKLSEYKRRAMGRLILGFQGLEPNQELKEVQQGLDPAGYILFGRNVDNWEQVLSCNQQLHQLSKANPPLISVDQEGGRVRRIKATSWPPMRKVGELNDLTLTKQIIQGINRELLALGFTANWAPCSDVDSNPDNPVIGDRAFHSNPNICANHVQVAIETMKQMGMMACAKHFPGHGDTDMDSHLDLPTVHKTVEEIFQCELVPFQRAVESQVDVMMTAHVIFRALDSEYPATMSAKILDGILRKKMGYQGVIVSDDMEMKAVRGRYPLDLQLDKSVRAGVDCFLVCSEHQLQQECFETLIALQEKYPEHRMLAEQSEKRLQTLHVKMQPSALVGDLSLVGCDDYQQLCEKHWPKSFV